MRAAIIVNPAKSDAADLREAGRQDAGRRRLVAVPVAGDDADGSRLRNGRGRRRGGRGAGRDLWRRRHGDGVPRCAGGTGLPVAMLPLGSGNLLARNLGIPLGLDESLDVAVNGDDRRIDLGRVGDQPFAVMAGMGFDAAMMADTTEGMKRLAGLAGLRRQCPAAPAGSGDAGAS